MKILSQKPKPNSQAETGRPYHHLGELAGLHAGKTAFVLGNGTSAEYYDIAKLAEIGILIGCNKAASRFPVNYLVFQDPGVLEECGEFKGIKFCPYGNRTRKKMDPDTTFFLHTSKMAAKDPSRIDFMHSGGMALQIAAVLGCEKIILVGCDCCFLEWEDGHRSNMFEDKQLRRVRKRRNGKGMKIRKTPHGVFHTINQLIGFADSFNRIYKELTAKEEVGIYRLGPWGILEIPIIEYEPFWSDLHPGKECVKGSNGRQDSTHNLRDSYRNAVR